MGLNTKQRFELMAVLIDKLRENLESMSAAAASQYANTLNADHLDAAVKLNSMLQETHNYIPIAKYDREFGKE